MIAKCGFMVLTLVLACCTHQNAASMCAFSDFASSPYDHIIEEMSPVTSREFAGRLRVRPEDVQGGVWPVGLGAQIELHGPGGFKEILGVEDDGTFARDDLKPGKYCLKISASGFRSVLGTVVIDRTARRTSLLDIELLIAE